VAVTFRRFVGPVSGVALLLGAAAAVAGPSGGSPVANPTDTAAGACLHDARAEGVVRRGIGRRMRRYLEPGQRVEVAFDCQRGAGPWSLSGLRTHGHAGGVTLLSVDARDGDSVVVRAARSARQPAKLGKPPVVVFAQTSLTRRAARAPLATALAALAAHVTVTEPPASRGAMSSSVTLSDDDEDLELRIMEGATPQPRHWDGYVGSAGEPDRAPLEIAWDALSSTLPARSAAAGPDALDRLTFSRLWVPDHRRRPWVHREMLSLAPVLAAAPDAAQPVAPDMARDIGADLDAPDPELRILAVNALAAVTGRDLRRDATGQVRPLDAVVVDYKAILRGR
jgi:hypothetical protein